MQIALDARAELGEGPVWDAAAQCLWWVNITAGAIHRWDPSSGVDTELEVGQDVGAIALRRSGGLIAGVRDGVLGVLADGTVERIADIEPEVQGNRCNDGKCDSAGRFWVGTMATDDSDRTGSLYRLDADGELVAMVTDVGLSNGLGWSPDDRTMYLVDTAAQAVDAFDFDSSSGDIDTRRRLITVDEADGSPDGMTVDAEGHLWVALHGGSAIRRYSPAGVLQLTIPLVVQQPTCPTFGGADLGDLYVTSAREGLSDEELETAPENGAVLRCRPGVRGLPSHPYAG